MSELSIRAAEAGDAAAMAAIFREGVEDPTATFETAPASDAEMAEADAPVLAAERAGAVVGWVKVGPYTDAHDYYASVGEATLYVARGACRRGIGRALLTAIAGTAEGAGYHKLVGKVFTANRASIELLQRCGWREVGVHRRHGRLDGAWRDVLVVERLLGDAAAQPGD